MVRPSMEAERSPSSQGSNGSADGVRRHGSFRRRSSSRSGRLSRDGTPDADAWGRSQKERVDGIEEMRRELFAAPECSDISDFDNHTLLRFLRARDYEVPKAVEMYRNHLRWRKENNVDTILTDFDFTEREAFLGVYPQGYYKTDKSGRPITIQHLGTIDLKRIKEVTSMDRMLKFHIQEYERFLKCITPICSRVYGKHIDTTFAILDVKGVSLKMLTGDVRKMLGDMTKIDQDHYPETLGKTCIINVPFVFKAVWALVRPMLQPRTQSKITLVGTRYMDELLKYIDIENIPEYLGGTSKNSLIDDAGPWNDPIVLSSLSKIAEDETGGVVQERPSAFAMQSRVSRTTLDDDRTTIRVAAPAEPHSPRSFSPSFSPMMAPPIAMSNDPTSTIPNSIPAVARVQELEASMRQVAGPRFAALTPPPNRSLLARVEFLEQGLTTLIRTQNQAVMEATRESEMKLQEANHELAMLRESQQDAVPPAQPKCCVIM